MAPALLLQPVIYAKEQPQAGAPSGGRARFAESSRVRRRRSDDLRVAFGQTPLRPGIGKRESTVNHS
jgi:hypothetical protein